MTATTANVTTSTTGEAAQQFTDDPSLQFLNTDNNRTAMSEDEFKSKEDLESWLRDARRVNSKYLGNNISILYGDGSGDYFITKGSLLGIKVDELERVGIKLPAARELSNKLRDDAPAAKAYLVGAIVRGAKQSKGARGNIFKFLERHMGHYSEQEGIQIFYEGDNLSVTAYFVSYDSACNMQTAVNQWEIHSALANLDGVQLDPPTPAQIDRPPDLKRIYLQDYKPGDYEASCRSIDQLHSYRLSIPPTTEADASSPLALYQCLDRQVVGYNPYKCHLKDKAKFKTLQSNENNLVAASWQLHQQMDGLNSTEGIPGVALSLAKVGNQRSAAHGNRIMVHLNLEFRNEYLANLFRGNHMPVKIDSSNWQIVVYVADAGIFSECVRWKHEDTKKKWRDHQHFLENI